MKIKDVMVEMQKTSIDPQHAKLAELGRTLMDMAASHKDDVESNQMASLGSAMTEFGTSFGPKNLMDIVKRTGLDPKAIQKMVGMAQERLKTAGPVRKAKDPVEQESLVSEGPQQMDIIGYNSGRGLSLDQAAKDPKYRRKVNVVELGFTPDGAPQLKFKELDGDGPFTAEWNPQLGWTADFD